jgi:hypothetical protein
MNFIDIIDKIIHCGSATTQQQVQVDKLMMDTLKLLQKKRKKNMPSKCHGETGKQKPTSTSTTALCNIRAVGR